MSFDLPSPGGSQGTWGTTLNSTLTWLKTQIENLTTTVSGKAATSHTHDDRYYTESETDTLLAAKAAASHDHNTLYYTETETDALLDAKVDTVDATSTFMHVVAYSSTTGWPARPSGVPAGKVLYNSSGDSAAPQPTDALSSGGTADAWLKLTA